MNALESLLGALNKDEQGALKGMCGISQTPEYQKFADKMTEDQDIMQELCDQVGLPSSNVTHSGGKAKTTTASEVEMLARQADKILIEIKQGFCASLKNSK